MINIIKNQKELLDSLIEQSREAVIPSVCSYCGRTLHSNEEIEFLEQVGMCPACDHLLAETKEEA